VVARDTILWEVDTQVDFMLPEGKLYVRGAEKLIPKINSLVDCARQDRVFLISSADAHNPDDPELQQWPPHCLKGTPGAALLPEAVAEPRLVVPNQKEYVLPTDLSSYRQVTFEKNTLNVFDNPNTDTLLARMAAGESPQFSPDPLFVVFGVATEHCVNRAAEGLLDRGKRVAIVTDAVAAIDEIQGKQLLDRFCSQGAQRLTTEEVLSRLARKASAS
jgi:nicotinamidase/pyrazinamidase